MRLFDQKVINLLYQNKIESERRARNRAVAKALLAVIIGASIGLAGVVLLAVLSGVLR